MQPKILLAEDDDVLRELIVSALEIAGYRVESFETGTAALMRLNHGPEDFAAVVTDYNMPGPDGLHVLMCLRRNVAFDHIPIIVYSNGFTNEMYTGVFEAGGFPVEKNFKDHCKLLAQLAAALPHR